MVATAARANDETLPLRVVLDTKAELVRDFRGWGVSLCWWAHVVGNFPEPAQREICDQIFDAERGLGLNIVRFNLGGGENPQHHFLHFRARMPGYQPQSGEWDWEADAGQQRILQLARARGADFVELFSNSPPYWMTISGSVSGNHDGKSNLERQREDDYIDYIVEAAAGLEQKLSITFDTVAPFNEPHSDWWKFGNRQEGCFVGRAQQERLLRRLHGRLLAKGLSAAVVGPEENSVKGTRESLIAYGPRTLGLLAQINTHTYFTAGRKELRKLAEGAGKDVWVSEYGDNDATGLTMARTIIADLTQLRAKAWVYWQAVDSAAGWGFFRNPLKDFETTAMITNEKYHVMGNFSRFIRPGMTLLDSTAADTVAACQPDAGRVVVVALNRGDRPRPIAFDLAALKISQPPKVHAYRTSGHEDLKDLGWVVLGADGATTLAPASVTTFVFDL